jgi:hypothetical protein
VAKRIGELRAAMPDGGLREAVIRSILYVGAPRASFDERGFEMVRRIRATQAEELPLDQFKAKVREQFFMLLVDREAAVAAIPALLPKDAEARGRGLAIVREVLAARGALDGESESRMRRIVGIFENQGSPLALVHDARQPQRPVAP